MNMYEFNLGYYKYLSITSNAKFHDLELSAKKSETHNVTSAFILSKYEVDQCNFMPWYHYRIYTNLKIEIT
jgi:hypothetical protein